MSNVPASNQANTTALREPWDATATLDEEDSWVMLLTRTRFGYTSIAFRTGLLPLAGMTFPGSGASPRSQNLINSHQLSSMRVRVWRTSLPKHDVATLHRGSAVTEGLACQVPVSSRAA
jgi:hypothetical protein